MKAMAAMNGKQSRQNCGLYGSIALYPCILCFHGVDNNLIYKGALALAIVRQAALFTMSIPSCMPDALSTSTPAKNKAGIILAVLWKTRLPKPARLEAHVGWLLCHQFAVLLNTGRVLFLRLIYNPHPNSLWECRMREQLSQCYSAQVIAIRRNLHEYIASIADAYCFATTQPYKRERRRRRVAAGGLVLHLKPNTGWLCLVVCFAQVSTLGVRVAAGGGNQVQRKQEQSR